MWVLVLVVVLNGQPQVAVKPQQSKMECHENASKAFDEALKAKIENFIVACRKLEIS